MIWYEFLLLAAFLASAVFGLFCELKEERKRTAAIVKRELAQRQFYELFMKALPLWESYLLGRVKQAPAQEHLTDLMIKSLEDIENV